MMSNGRVQTQQVEGQVEATNANGLRLAGTNSWLNVSRFHPVPIPEAGAHVRVDVDSKGYIREIEILDDGPAHTPAPPTASRDHTIARLTVLKAAAHFAAARTDIKSADVLTIAERWLAWVTADD